MFSHCRPQIIDAYIKIRTTKDETYIRQVFTMDEAQKEEYKREKRRIQVNIVFIHNPQNAQLL